MPICSYLVIPEPGSTAEVRARLAGIVGCDVVAARNRDVLILVTDTASLDEEAGLRARVEATEGIRALMLTFGEIDPDTSVADPIATGRP